MKPPLGTFVPSPIELLEARIAPAAAEFSLSSLNGDNGFRLNGIAQGDYTGGAVSLVGDLNDDGFDDLVVGAPQADANGVDSGGLCVIFGTDHGIPAELNLIDVDGSNGFFISGEAAGDGAGFSVGAGDINKDGLNDLIIGAPDASPNGSSSGAMYIVYGRTSFPFNIILSANAVGVGKIVGAAAGDCLGFSVGSGGDLTGDGFDEILIGAPGASSGSPGDKTGAAYVLFGASSYPNPLALSNLNPAIGFKIEGETSGDEFGISVREAEDINRDGLHDFVIGAVDLDEGGTGGAYVIFGSSNFSGPIQVGGLNGPNGFRIIGVDVTERAGSAVDGAGDINGDGFDDIVIGAPGADPHGVDSGAVYVIFGKASGFAPSVRLSSLANPLGFKIEGDSTSDAVGTSVAEAGDFNGDGIGDLLIGAPGAAQGTGAAYLILGSNAGFADVIDLSELDAKTGLKIVGEAEGDNTGIFVASAGDFDDDGDADLVISAPGADANGTDSGAAYLVEGFNTNTQVEITDAGRLISLTEADGDIVSIKISRPGLTARDIVLAPDGSIELLDLTSLAPSSAAGGKFKPLNISIGVKTPAGDGLTKVGLIKADGVSLGKLKLKGDLGSLVAGLSNSGIGAKNISISGNLGSTSGAGALSQIFGSLGKLSVKGDFLQNSIQVDGKVNSVKIAGDFTGTPNIPAAMLEDIAEEGFAAADPQLGVFPAGVFLAESIRSLKIGGAMKGGGITTTKDLGVFSILGELRNGNLFGGGGIKAVKVGRVISDDPNAPVTITARNNLGSMIINGDVENARILAGYSTDEMPVNADATVGRVLVKGDWIASSLVAGIDDVTSDGFGQNDVVISGDSTAAVSRIASVVIKGTASGTAAAGDHYGITAQEIGKVSIGGESLPRSADPDDILVDTTNNDFRVVEISAP